MWSQPREALWCLKMMTCWCLKQIKMLTLSNLLLFVSAFIKDINIKTYSRIDMCSLVKYLTLTFYINNSILIIIHISIIFATWFFIAALIHTQMILLFLGFVGLT